MSDRFTQRARSAIERARTILHLRTVPLFFGPAEEYADSEIGRTFMEGRD